MTFLKNAAKFKELLPKVASWLYSKEILKYVTKHDRGKLEKGLETLEKELQSKGILTLDGKLNLTPQQIVEVKAFFESENNFYKRNYTFPIITAAQKDTVDEKADAAVLPEHSQK